MEECCGVDADPDRVGQVATKPTANSQYRRGEHPAPDPCAVISPSSGAPGGDIQKEGGVDCGGMDESDAALRTQSVGPVGDPGERGGHRGKDSQRYQPLRGGLSLTAPDHIEKACADPCPDRHGDYKWMRWVTQR